LLLGRKKRIVEAMDGIVQNLRLRNTLIKCFYPRCREQALFYREIPKGGTWYACSEQHMNTIGSDWPEHKPISDLTIVKREL